MFFNRVKRPNLNEKRTYIFFRSKRNSMKKYFVYLTLLLSACTTLPTSAEYVTRGDGFVEDGNFKKAIASYTKAISMNSKNYKAYAARGAAYFFDGQYNLAEDDFLRVLNVNPYYANAYTAYASTLAVRGDYQNALTLLKVAQQLDPKKPEIYFSRAGIYFMLGEYDKAVQDYTIVLSLRPAVEVLNARGAAYLKMGRTDLAEQDFEAAKKEPLPEKLNDYSMVD